MVFNRAVKSFIRLSFFFFILSSNACMSSKVCSDQDKNCSIQEQIYSMISAPQGIYLYSTQTTYQGNLAAYGSTLDDSLHNICTVNRVFASIINPSCMNVLPLVSTSTNVMYNFPGLYGVPDNVNFPIRGARGELIANTWSNLFAGLFLTFEQAGVTSQTFWTFANGGGGYNSADNCIVGTNTGATGAIGSPIDNTTNWPLTGAPACAESHPIICVCY
ncbi:hypothetical protein CH363_10250 [Leptospira haakeii]|uniref:DUF1554 domain-containing protein n=2 Tax=Leptospira haakeii TaxID=2023198 RepID=A0ABX4PJE5_9LEPT|nr:hypothetical protein CH363_10250 [Leptospira haakeii]PKA19410.1 hypothetical protein CH377_12425 [Leptospira haakeii]